jgi:hypothetical protein
MGNTRDVLRTMPQPRKSNTKEIERLLEKAKPNEFTLNMGVGSAKWNLKKSPR